MAAQSRKCVHEPHHYNLNFDIACRLFGAWIFSVTSVLPVVLVLMSIIGSYHSAINSMYLKVLQVKLKKVSCCKNTRLCFDVSDLQM